MTKKEQWEFFTDALLDSAVDSYKTTWQYKEYREKLIQMEHDCEDHLDPSDFSFIMECFELLMDSYTQQGRYLYKQGFADCISILKRLGILA